MFRRNKDANSAMWRNEGPYLGTGTRRFRAQLVQRKATNETFSGKATRLLFWKHTLGPLYCTQKPQSLGNAVPKQRPQTLDLLFANMKEQRMRALSQQNNGRRRNGGGQLRQQWGRGRGRFGN
ncbi:hypothetical protein U1Q18_034570 [Sarracenia purpurea var. burkii]